MIIDLSSKIQYVVAINNIVTIYSVINVNYMKKNLIIKINK